MNAKSMIGQIEERRARLDLSSGTVHPPAGVRRLPDFVDLPKTRLLLLALFTALVSLSLAPVRLNPQAPIAAVLAIDAGAEAAGALNLWYGAHIDAVMS